VNYVYGTSGAVVALALLNAQQFREPIRRGMTWLSQVQNRDGGWGETCASYKDTTLKGQGDSTASQTAWALMGLLAAAEANLPVDRQVLERGVQYLLSTQRSDGTWDEPWFTGTGFPGHFYLKYHLYQQHFPLTALGRYRSLIRRRVS
jgi:squalene-hopene/tetraprenyl-beta-curcumene cyclase